MANIINSIGNAKTIKREYEDGEMRGAYSQFQMKTTSSTTLNDEEEQGDERNGLQFYENFAAHNVDGEMDLDKNGENGRR